MRIIAILLILFISGIAYAEKKWMAPVPNPEGLSNEELALTLDEGDLTYICISSGCWYILTEEKLESSDIRLNSSDKDGWVEMLQHKLEAAPDDKFIYDQWSIQNPTINWLGGWENSLAGLGQDPSIMPVIAVLDSGFGNGSGHEDFDPGRFYNNRTYGFHAVGNTFDVCDNTTCPDNVTDFIPHGSHVIGIIGADTNNSLGMASVSGGNVKILSIKVTDGSSDNISQTYSLKALDYVARLKEEDVNIVAVNASWGALYPSYSSAEAGGGYFLEASLNKLNDLEILLIAAGGNDGLNMSTEGKAHLPSDFNLPNIISVVSVNSALKKSSFTNFARRATIAAPGERIFSLDNISDEYILETGTSMAAPYVTGAIGASYYINNSLTGPQLLCILLESASSQPTLYDVLEGDRLININDLYSYAENPSLAGCGMQTMAFPERALYDSRLPSNPTNPDDVTQLHNSSGCSLGSSGKPFGDLALLLVSAIIFLLYRRSDRSLN